MIIQNQRRSTFLDALKAFLLKRKYTSRLELKGRVRILGNLPSIKLPLNSKLIIGDMVVLNSDTKNSNTALTNSCTLVCGLMGKIEIGENTQLNGVSITAYSNVKIGSNCQIASNTFISDTDFHPIDPTIRERECLGYKFDHAVVNKMPIEIGKNVWIGWGVIILKGVRIGDNSIIAAGSVVLSDVTNNVLVAGNPAVIKKKLD